jgi:hypothetical protein
MTSRADLDRWVRAYETAWRSPGTERLGEVFTDDATYRQSPYAEPVVGIQALAAMWEAERAGPDEVFTLETEIVAVEGETGVVRAFVQYGQPVTQEYRDLWVVRLDDQGRSQWFEEWPFWPDQPYAAR